MRLSVMVENNEVLNTVFDTVGTDRMNWFRPQNILSSSFTDLNSDVKGEHFSIEGWVSSAEGYSIKSHGVSMIVINTEVDGGPLIRDMRWWYFGRKGMGRDTGVDAWGPNIVDMGVGGVNFSLPPPQPQDF